MILQMRPTPLALAAALLFGGGGAAWSQVPTPAPDAAALEPSRKLMPPPRGEAARRLPIVVRAQSIRARPDLEAVAEGDVEFRRGGTVIGADRLSYEQAEDLAVARGHVRIQTEGAIYTGPELQLRVQRFEGFFLEPTFEFLELGAGGRAQRVDFLDSARAVATNAIYTSCPRDGSGDPDWVLETRRVKMDFDANEGIAEGAVLRFLGAPILALPALSFPLTDARKSGWLPPSVNLDSRSGFEFSIPYYWNIAPNRDATIAPRVITRRGLGADGEFRYLQPKFDGALNLSLLPDDRVYGSSRAALQWRHDGRLRPGLFYGVELNRVSDDAWWKDFPDAGRSLTPRLLGSRAAVERPFVLGAGEGLAYARLHHWQVLQGSDTPVVPPHQRSPQIGLRWSGGVGGGFELAAETELNRFTLPTNDPQPQRLTGLRAHAIGSLARPWRGSGWFVVPRLSLNAAAYDTDQPWADGRHAAGRTVPTFSVDAGLELERRTSGFGRALRQTLEPRLLYVNTPYRAQSALPNFDSAVKDFNFQSIYAENPFSGVDRVADTHQITAGVTTRLVDEATGAEALRLGVVQRVLLRDQLIAPNADGTPDGPPLQQRVSDLLLLGSTTVFPHWTLDGSLQYSPDLGRPVRSILGARWSPGPFRTLSATYRLARGLNEQLELGWQWPLRLARPTPASEAAASGVGAAAAARGGGGACGGSWYAVGRFNYSLKDSRITDSILGLEYDAGCWIGRVVAERLSTGRSEATTRLLLQLELVGLSRIGSNPLRVLKDNIPGYRLLREERRAAPNTDVE
jgi:LPS-assembly protein